MNHIKAIGRVLLIVMGLAIMAGADTHVSTGAMLAQYVVGLAIFAAALLPGRWA